MLLATLLVLLLIELLALFHVLTLLLRVVIPLTTIVLHSSFLAGLLDFLLPIHVNQLIVAQKGREYFFKFTFKDTITKFVFL